MLRWCPMATCCKHRLQLSSPFLKFRKSLLFGQYCHVSSERRKRCGATYHFQHVWLALLTIPGCASYSLCSEWTPPPVSFFLQKTSSWNLVCLQFPTAERGGRTNYYKPETLLEAIMNDNLPESRWHLSQWAQRPICCCCGFHHSRSVTSRISLFLKGFQK